jgi:hypothetical protein
MKRQSLWLQVQLSHLTGFEMLLAKPELSFLEGLLVLDHIF